MTYKKVLENYFICRMAWIHIEIVGFVATLVGETWCFLGSPNSSTTKDETDYADKHWMVKQTYMIKGNALSFFLFIISLTFWSFT